MWMLSLYLHVNQKSDDDDDDEFRDTIKKIISFSIKFKRDLLKFYRLSESTLIVPLVPYINLLNLSWIIKCLFLSAMGALNQRSQKK